ncbi:glycosyltransferase [uncultured Cohaesibacter sp.]|uniref:glycosyltransferase n=1 Tax=uncultured Cohaesibacter sp. TaxID=1002546 RepID=UPI0029C987B4|nr:glycosyltransferase [uncultured Cohaesibacter sp.]
MSICENVSRRSSRKTDYPDYEVIILDNDSAEDETKRYFAEISDRFGVRVLPYPGEFNYSALNNFGVGHAHGDVIALLNNDVEVINGRWLSELVSYAIRPDIGAAGARLLYDDETIQHAGVIIGVSGVADPCLSLLSHPTLRLQCAPAAAPIYLSRNRGLSGGRKVKVFLPLEALMKRASKWPTTTSTSA